MAASSSTLKLQTNVPETISLKFADGLPVSSQYAGDQVMFTLVDDRKRYLSQAVAQKIRDAGIALPLVPNETTTSLSLPEDSASHPTAGHDLTCLALAFPSGPENTSATSLPRDRLT